jgi:hypothetical protein
LVERIMMALQNAGSPDDKFVKTGGDKRQGIDGIDQ